MGILHNNFVRKTNLLVLLFLLIAEFSAFAITKISTGSGNWGTSSLWSPAGVPTATDTVSIDNGHTITINSMATCGVLIIGVSDVGASSLVQFETTAAQTLTITGNLLVKNGKLITQVGNTQSHSLLVGGQIYVPTNSALILNIPTSTTLTFNGTTPQSISSTGTLSTLNIIINNPAGVTLSTSLSATNLTLTTGILALNYNELILLSNNPPTRTSGLIDASGDLSIINFANTSPLTIPSGLFTGDVQNLTLSGTGGVTLGSNTTIVGTLSLLSGSLTVGANTLILKNKFPVPVLGSIIATNPSSVVAFTNTSPITLSSGTFSGTVNNLTVNGIGGVVLGANTTVSTLALNSGNLTLGNNNLTVNNTLLGGSSASFVVTNALGALIRPSVLNDLTGFFPVGASSTSYTPVTLTNGGSTTFGVNVNGITLNIPQFPKAINRVWNITPTGTPSDVVLKFGYMGNEGGATFNATPNVMMDGLKLVSGQWTSYNTTMPTGSFDATFTHTGSAWQSPSSFTFGIKGILPVELLDITAKSQKSENLITWKTVSERNLAQFDILRSSNGQTNWQAIGSTKATGNNILAEQDYQFVDKYPLSMNYYRLRSIDFDGSESLSKIVSAQRETKEKLIVYPTSATTKITIALESDDLQTFHILNLYGQIVQIGEFKAQKEVMIGDLTNGAYILKVGENMVKFFKN